MFVSGWQQALTLVAVLIPGFVFQGVLRARVGPSPDDRDLTARLIRALGISVGFLLVYTLCLGPSFLDRLLDPQHELSDSPRIISIAGLVMVFVLPATAGHLVASFQTRRSYCATTFWKTFTHKAVTEEGQMTWSRALFSTESNYNPVPTAWDFATSAVQLDSFVRVLDAQGQWVGGQISEGAYFTSYPEPRAVFIDRAWSLSEEGEFLDQLPGPTGLWIDCDGAQLMQIVPPPDGEAEETAEPVPDQASVED